MEGEREVTRSSQRQDKSGHLNKRSLQLDSKGGKREREREGEGETDTKKEERETDDDTHKREREIMRE
jgi:hypothetical protein